MAKKKKKSQGKSYSYQQQPKSSNSQSSGFYLVAIAALVLFCVGLLLYINDSGRKGAGTGSPEELQKAIVALEAQLKGSPNDLATLVNLGNAYYDTGQWPKAIEAYEKSIKIDPKNPNVLTDCGTAYWYSNPPQPDNAIEKYDQALKLDGTFANAILNKGIVLRYGKKDAKLALEQWERYLKLKDAQEKTRVEGFIKEAKKYQSN